MYCTKAKRQMVKAIHSWEDIGVNRLMCGAKADVSKILDKVSARFSFVGLYFRTIYFYTVGREYFCLQRIAV